MLGHYLNMQINKNNERPTKCSCNKVFSGNSSLLPCLNFCVGKQVQSPQSLTTATLDRYVQKERTLSAHNNAYMLRSQTVVSGIILRYL